jgi:hypothetical protein
MQRRWLSLVLLAAACHGRPVASTPDGGAVAQRPPAPADAGPVLSLSKLDAFLAYERALRADATPTASELRRLSRTLDAGSAALEQAYLGLKRRADRAQALRTGAGLSPTEVQTMEALTVEIAMARAGEGGAELAQALEELTAARDQLPADQRAGVDRTLERLRDEQARARSLADVRAHWGDGPVDLVLQRERAVLDLWGVTGR